MVAYSLSIRLIDSKKVKYSGYKIVLAVCDFILLRLSFSAALQFRGIALVRTGQWTVYLLSPEFYFFFVYAFIVVLIFQYNNLYKINIVLTRSRQIVLIYISFLYSIIGLAVLAFFVHSRWIVDSRLAVAYFGVIGISFISFYRLCIFSPLFIFLKRNLMIRKNLLIVGANMAAKTFAIQIELDNIYGFKLAGFVEDGIPVGTKVFESFKILGNVSDIPAIVERNAIDEIIVTVSEVDHEELLRIIDMCKRTKAAVRVTSSLFDVIHRKVFSESYFNIPVASLAAPNEFPGMLFFKRVFDIVAAAIGILFLSIPLLIITILVKLSSDGPILYKQVRIGKDGKKFDFYKFRSMYMGSDQDNDRIEKAREFIKKGHGNGNGNGSVKVVNEKMITPIGRFLRKTSIDELPQFFNVLKGDMSLVGPRPCLPYEYDHYDEWHKRRLSILPGCTGLWQVSSRSEVGFNDMVLLDLYYIDNLSPWLDLQLILKTIPVMILGRGGK
jgi:undecaprenyl-phosphate galactose phosphotransferase